MSSYTNLPIDTVDGALAYANSYIDDAGEWGFEADDVAKAFATLAAELRRLRPELAD